MAAETVDRETGEVLAGSGFPTVRIDRRFVINQQGREYVLSDGLIEGLHQLSLGFFEVDTRIEQLPNEANGMVAVCAAKVTIYEPGDGERALRSATGIGDASAASVTKTIGPHLIRMAETRALNRALRVLLGVGAVSFEELGPGGAEDSPSRAAEATSAPFTPPDRIQVDGRSWTRWEVWNAYRDRVALARKAGLAVPDDQAGLGQDAPLSVLVAASQELRRRMEARDGTGK